MRVEAIPWFQADFLVSSAAMLEADRLAVRTMAGAGYDPGALVRYISRVQRPSTAVQEIFSALPSAPKRVAVMEQEIRELPARSYGASQEFHLVQEEVRRLQPAPSLMQKNRN